MNKTTHYEFNLPDYTQFADVEDLTENWSAADEALFNQLYSLCTKTTVIDEDSSGHDRITETAEDGTEAVTIIVPTSETVTTITTTITYGGTTIVKTTVITETASNTTFEESYA